jgi:hypothetical protein
MTDVPAHLLGRGSEIVAWNALADAVVGFSAMPADQRNTARFTFLDPRAQALFGDWPTVASETVAALSSDAARHPDDPGLAALIGELAIESETFRELWARHDVLERHRGRKRIRHPLVGDLDFAYQALAIPDEPDLLLVLFVAAPGSPTAQRLRILASWTTPGADGGVGDPSGPRLRLRALADDQDGPG